MSKVIDELREHFNQRPVPNSKVIIEERSKVNAMIDAIETENDKLRELAYVSLNYCANGYCSTEDGCPWNKAGGCVFVKTCRELGIKED